jgi:hypothetical protein
MYYHAGVNWLVLSSRPRTLPATQQARPAPVSHSASHSQNGVVLLIAQHEAKLHLRGCKDGGTLALLAEHAANHGVEEDFDWLVASGQSAPGEITLRRRS